MKASRKLHFSGSRELREKLKKPKKILDKREMEFNHKNF
jgi:hypothetical protein